MLDIHDYTYVFALAAKIGIASTFITIFVQGVSGFNQFCTTGPIFLICFPMDYRDFSVKSKVIIHCFKQWDYDFRFSLFVNSFYRR